MVATNQPDRQEKLKDTQSNLADVISMIVNKVFARPLDMMVIVGSAVLMCMMLLMTADVVGRYILKHPITGADEVVGFLLLCLAACSIAYTQKEKAHVRVILIAERLSPRSQTYLDVLVHFLGLAIVALISWQMFNGGRIYFIEPRLTENLSITWFPFMFLLGIGFTIFGIIILADLLFTIAKAVKR